MHKNRIYSLNEDYFKNIDTEEKAYFLGFIFADGSNAKYPNRKLSIVIHEKDVHILLKLKELIKYTGDIKTVRIKYKGLTINSAKISKDLEKWGAVPNKTLLLNNIPEISENLLSHFIRGYFDGDGYVGIARRGRKKENALRINIVGTDSFLINIQKILISNGLSKTKFQSYKNPIVKGLEYSGNKQCKLFYKYIYKDCNICLYRKKEKFEQIQ